MNEIEIKLKEAIKGLFAEERIDLVIGYERGTLPLRSRPSFIKSTNDIDRLLWDSSCANNLAVFLPRLFERPTNPRQEYNPPKVGIVAKGCDHRSIVGLIKEHQVIRDHIVVVGVPCQGIVDLAKLEAELNGDIASEWEVDSEGMLHVTATSGKVKSIPLDDILADACAECEHPVLEFADVIVEGEPKKRGEKGSLSVREFEAKSSEERWQCFFEEISKCIRCHACRQACPNCYCNVCFADQIKPRWIGASDELSDVMLYHIGRIYHQAGRCVECDACVRACPMGIDLRPFIRKLGEDVKELFGYVPGLSEDGVPPLCTFEQDDKQDFVTEP